MNDAQILKSILDDHNGLSNILNKDDTFVVDRSFRDSIETLKKLDYQVLMPALKSKRSQLTTKEANDSRCLTMIRWVVEAVHGF